MTTTSSSLVGSIFGEVSSKKDKLSGLFDKSASLPLRPSHKPPVPAERKIAKEPAAKAPQIRKRRHDDETREKDAEESPVTETEETTNDMPKDDNDAEARTVFVGNLPLSTTRKTLASLFRPCGKVESTRLRSMATTGVKVSQDRAGDQDFVKKACAISNKVDTDAKSSVQGYVVFAEISCVEEALKWNNQSVGDHQIRVDRATPTLDAARSVFVGNLPYQADESSLRYHFCQGCDLEPTDVENVRIIRDKSTMQCKGFGYVLFREKSMVANALQKMHDKPYKKRNLRVTVCGKRFKNRKGASGQDEPPAKRKGKQTDVAGALKRVLAKGNAKRKRGVPKGSAKPSVKKAGVSKRAAAEAKATKRLKKLQKRVTKGMGKNRKR